MYPEHKLRGLIAAQAADVGMVGNGGFVTVLAGALGEHRETGPATSTSTSTFSTVASISGLSKSVCTRKSAICCVDNTKSVGNGGFVLAGALGVRTETGPAASASDSTFSTVASISGKSLKVSKSLSTRKSAVCCVDSAKSATVGVQQFLPPQFNGMR